MLRHGTFFSLYLGMKYLLICLLFCPLFSFAQQKDKEVTAFWRTEIKKALANKKNQRVVDMVIPDSATAVVVAEPILFKVYGKDEILGEKPYKVNSVDGYWVLTGTLPEGYVGGTFVIIMAAKDARVIKLIHYK
jgi:hypothetical protein